MTNICLVGIHGLHNEPKLFGVFDTKKGLGDNLLNAFKHQCDYIEVNLGLQNIGRVNNGRLIVC